MGESIGLQREKEESTDSAHLRLILAEAPEVLVRISTGCNCNTVETRDADQGQHSEEAVVVGASHVCLVQRHFVLTLSVECVSNRRVLHLVIN